MSIISSEPPILDISSARTCTINGVIYRSVIDIISATCECNYEAARQKWKYMKDDQDSFAQSIIENVIAQKFKGHNVEVADAETLASIIVELPGKKASQFRKSAACYLRKCFEPDQDFVNVINDRFEHMADPNHVETDPNVVAVFRKVTLNKRISNHTHVYIRVRVPDEHLCNSTNVKALTIRSVKFGIAFNINDRNSDYMSCPDNGFMIYSIVCRSRTEALAIENILKANFARATIYGSYEYVDVAKVAEHFGLPDPGDDYEAYISIATRLFAEVVRFVKYIWPTSILPGYGIMYEPHEVDRVVDYDAKPITVEIAAKMGIDHAIEALKESSNASDDGQSSSSSSSANVGPLGGVRHQVPPKKMGKTNGQVVARNVLTGEETTYDCATTACVACIKLRALTISPKLLQQTYIDCKRQIGGFTWRSKFQEKSGVRSPTSYWIPPSGFVFDPDQRNTGVQGYVSAIVVMEDGSDGEKVIYESCQMAARANSEDERRLNGHVRGGETHNGITWRKVEYENAGRWSDEAPMPEEEDGTYVPPKLVSAPAARIVASGANGRTYGRIIARDLSTGLDVIFANADRVRDRFNVSPNALRETYIDKPRQIYGHHLRSFASGRVWHPPATFVYDKEKWERSKQGYIVGVKPSDGTTSVMYESLSAAGDALSVAMGTDARKISQNISYRLGKNVEYNGFFWRKANPEDYETFDEDVQINLADESN
jgi:hypothetical protein